MESCSKSKFETRKIGIVTLSQNSIKICLDEKRPLEIYKNNLKQCILLVINATQSLLRDASSRTIRSHMKIETLNAKGVIRLSLRVPL